MKNKAHYKLLNLGYIYEDGLSYNTYTHPEYILHPGLCKTIKIDTIGFEVSGFIMLELAEILTEYLREFT